MNLSSDLGELIKKLIWW